MTGDIVAAAKVLWDFHCVYHDLRIADAIVGLGSYDLRVADRCSELFLQGYAREIIFTGKSGNWTQDMFPESEAQAFAVRAIKAGVPQHAITIEGLATNIGENVTFSAHLIPNAKVVIFVTKPQTQLRCQLTVHKQWKEVDAVVTAPLTEFWQQPTPDHDQRALICELVGDTQRAVRYPDFGYQAPVAITGDVTAAFDLLIKAGFTDHLMTDQ